MTNYIREGKEPLQLTEYNPNSFGFKFCLWKMEFIPFFHDKYL